MKSTFTIDGMTCSGCAAKVTYTLQQIDSVSGVAWTSMRSKRSLQLGVLLTSPKSQQISTTSEVFGCANLQCGGIWP